MLGEERPNSNDKARFVQLAVETFEKDQFKSAREAARAFGVNYGTLRRRLNGTPAKRDISRPSLLYIAILVVIWAHLYPKCTLPA
jgi:DNA invertase Pin-like site-specific DNA recombinase